MPGFAARIGFISAVSHKFCDRCNRIRLTSEGKLRLCLQSQNGMDLKAHLRKGCTDEELLELLIEGIRQKPKEHHFQEENIQSAAMAKIGG